MSVNTDLKIVDNVFVKMMNFYYAGDKSQGHAHTYDHITLLAKGAVIMRANGQEVTHQAPKLIVTPKGVIHEFESLTPDCILCCVHAIRDGDTDLDIASPDITIEEAEVLLQQFPLAR
jgi:quercetin dioxygenase-like cupin family protein